MSETVCEIKEAGIMGPNEKSDDKSDKSNEYAGGNYTPSEAEQEWLDDQGKDDSFHTPSNTER